VSTSLEDEYRSLLETTAALEREHRELQDAPYDRENHAAHRDKLRQHINHLHAYLERLHRERDGPAA
jgi:hypothetical protein